ncbi:MAG: DMT family transporter [Bacteroidales bacterium]|nr:DMT family transporter [Bacteroidales bacterium]
MKIKANVYVAIVVAMLFWSFSFIWFKMANVFYQPIAIVFMRLLIAVALLSLYLWLTGGLSWKGIRREDRKYFLMLGIFEPFLYFLGESFGLTYVSSTAGSVLIATIPVFATIGAWLLFRERLKPLNYAGIVLSFLGVLVFILNRDGSLSYNITGLLLMLLAVLSAVGYNLTLRHLAGGYNPVFIVNVQNIVGLVLFLPLFLIFDLKDVINMSHTVESLTPVVLLAVFASCGAFILFAYSVRYLGITRSNVFSNSIPVFTAIFAFILLNEVLTFQNLIGMIIVIAGLFLSQINGRRNIKPEAEILTGKTA